MAKKRPAVAKTPIDLDALVAETVADVVDRRTDSDASAPTAETLRWANDCYWVAENLDERMSKAKAGTTFRFALWKHARDNMDSFIGTMLPKAMAILDRQLAKTTDDGAMAKHEEKSIIELERILRAAIVEAREMSV